MKIKMEQILGISAFCNALVGTKMKASNSFLILDIMEKIKAPIENFEKIKKEVVDKYVEKNDEGSPVVKNNMIQLKKDLIQEFEKEMEELILTEIEIGEIEIPFSLVDAAEITPAELLQIKDFIKKD